MTHPVFSAVVGSKPKLGGWVTFDAFPVAELLADVGFDYIGIDTQHGMLDVPGAAKLLYAVPTNGPPVLVRVPANNTADIGRLLDCGADGVIVPMINSAQGAAEAVAACRYAPAGVRSFGPVRRHIGRDLKTLDQRAACFVMIETAQALEVLEEIASTPGLAGIYLGPADLAIGLGLPPAETPTPNALRDAQRKIARACAQAGIVAGGHGSSAAHCVELLEDGYGLISLTADKAYMLSGATTLLAEVRKYSA